MHKQDDTKKDVMANVETFLEFATTFQGRNESCPEFMIQFKSRVDTGNAHGGRTGYHHGMLRKILLIPTQVPII